MRVKKRRLKDKVGFECLQLLSLCWYVFSFPFVAILMISAIQIEIFVFSYSNASIEKPTLNNDDFVTIVNGEVRCVVFINT